MDDGALAAIGSDDASDQRRLTRDDFGLAGRAEPPIDSIETAVLLMFASVLDVGGIGMEDCFFDLGGDSLAAASLMVEIDSVFGVALPVSTILEASTARRLATLVRQYKREVGSALLVPVSTAGKGSPLICVHGVTGEVAFARALAVGLGLVWPVYGLRAAGLGRGEMPATDIATMASRYIDAAVAADLVAPSVLVGYCGGAWVAYEMAHQLLQAGRPVRGVIMIDPPRPASVANGRESLCVSAQRWRSRLRGVRLRALFKATYGHEARRDLVRRAFLAALGAYRLRPQPLRTKLLVVHNAQQRAALGVFERLGACSISFCEAGPDHRSLFTTTFESARVAIGAFLDHVAPLDTRSESAQSPVR